MPYVNITARLKLHDDSELDSKSQQELCQDLQEQVQEYFEHLASLYVSEAFISFDEEVAPVVSLRVEK